MMDTKFAPSHDSAADRRSFLIRATYALAGLFSVLLGIPTLAYLIDPRNRPAMDNGFETVARLRDLPIGKPREVVLRAARRDAWTLHPEVVIGRVWLIRRDQERVDAFTATCPHLGCSINFEEKTELFLCPCHSARFTLDGLRVQQPGTANPAPRGMDGLGCQRDPANPELIQVRYQNFIQGTEARVPKT